MCEEMKSKKINKVIKLTDRHSVTFDRYQFILRTGKFNEEEDKKESYNVLYFKKMSHLCNHVLAEEFKEGINLYELRDLSLRVEELLIDPFENEKEIMTTWFKDFLVTEQVEKELNTLKNKVNKLEDENEKLKQQLKDMTS